MQITQICTDTTGKLNSLKLNTTGGGKLIGFSTNWKLPEIIQVIIHYHQNWLKARVLSDD